MATTVVPTPFQDGDCYKYHWARYVAKETLRDDHKALKSLISNVLSSDQHSRQYMPSVLGDLSIQELFEETKGLTGGDVIPPSPGNFNIGIVGAGVSGHFTALLFDWLHDHEKIKGSFKIDYDINSRSRVWCLL